MKTPEKLLHFPEGSILEDVVDYYTRTAIYPQPQFAVVAGLMIGAMVLGRNYCTDQENYTNIFIVGIADSSAGKEKIRKVIEEFNRKANLDFVGPSNYTSQAGVYSALLRRPSHLTVIDEWGRVLKANKRSQNSNSDTAMTALMQLFGQTDGVYQPQGYSEINRRNKPNAEENAELPIIVHPCISVVAMTAPGTFWESIKGENIEDGFLPRFLIIKSEMPLTEKQKIDRTAKPSSRVIDWMIDHAFPITDPIYSDDKTHKIYKNPEIAPEPISIPFSKEAEKLWREYDKKIVARRNNEINNILRCMWGKTEEITRRISLIIALSRDHDTITGEDYTWARDFVDYYTIIAIEEADINISQTILGELTKKVWNQIKEAGPDGLTEREITRKVKKMEDWSPKQRQTVMDTIKADHDIEFIKGYHGTKRDVWIMKSTVDQVSPNFSGVKS
jgi:hypothetical protein